MEERFGDVTVTMDSSYVGTVEMHRPPENFFEVEVIRSLADAYEALDAEPDCRAILLCAEGKHFCAGANLGGGSSSSADGGSAEGPDQMDIEAARLFGAGTPVVAAVQGAAIGAGFGLACLADFRVGSPAGTVRGQLRPARLPPHSRPHDHPAGHRRPAACPQPPVHRATVEGRRGAGHRPVRPTGGRRRVACRGPCDGGRDRRQRTARGALHPPDHARRPRRSIPGRHRTRGGGAGGARVDLGPDGGRPGRPRTATGQVRSAMTASRRIALGVSTSSSWELRYPSPDLVRHYRDSGWWNDDTLTEIAFRGVVTSSSVRCRVRSHVHPFTGTIGDVGDMGRRLAGTLARRGIESGDVVAFQLPNWVEAVACFYGLLSLGVVVVPIVHIYGSKETVHILRQSRARVLITADHFARQDYVANLEAGLGDLPGPRDGDRRVGGRRPDAEAGHDRAVLVRGTRRRPAEPAPTGRPRQPRARRLHLGHHRRAEGRDPHPPQLSGRPAHVGHLPGRGASPGSTRDAERDARPRRRWATSSGSRRCCGRCSRRARSI